MNNDHNFVCYITCITITKTQENNQKVESQQQDFACAPAIRIFYILLPPSLPPSLHEQDTFEHLLDLKADLNCLTNYLPIYTKV